MGPGHVRYPLASDLQLFSLARSPAAPAPRAGFWLGRPAASGARSPSGGYAPTIPGAAAAFGAKGASSTELSKVDSLPSEQQLHRPSGHGLRVEFDSD